MCTPRLPLFKVLCCEFKRSYYVSFASRPCARPNLLNGPDSVRTRTGLEGRSVLQRRYIGIKAISFLRQTLAPPADPKVSLEGKNVVVTGANASLDFEAYRQNRGSW